MLKLTEFLHARLTELAEQQKNSSTAWHRRDCAYLPEPGMYDAECDCGVPERVLAETEAKQRVVKAYDNAVISFGHTEVGAPLHDLMGGSVNSLRHVLQLLALPYSGHPNYKEEWKP